MIKRIIDITLAIVLSIPATPMCVAIATAIWLESKGSPLFFSSRVGMRGRLFQMMKFRTMTQGSAVKLNEQQMRELNEHFKLRDDPRVTRVGRWLRKYSLDELPQLINVLKGEMSFVGPRPKLPEEIGLYGDSQKELLSVLPGITGYWQVHRTSAESDSTMREMDLLYVRTRNLRRDLLLLFETLFVIARKSNY
jgi:lipopolysaccharide/colanic/teichoic acid biosynthesis glycosyltransferase